MGKNNNKPLILITGAMGQIGSALTHSLKKEYEVIGFDRAENAPDIAIDFASPVSISSAFKLVKEKYQNKIAAVIHLAAYFDFSGEKSSLYEEVNVNGTQRLLDALQDFEVERFIFASTMLVHEPCEPGETINEDTPVSPKWAYPESKIETEKIIKTCHGKIPYLILRIAGVYDDDSCIPTLAQQITRTYERNIKSNLYAGNIKAGQAFIHKKDLVSLFENAIKYRHKFARQETILAGEPKTLSYEKIQSLISEIIHGEDAELLTVPASVAKVGAWLEEKLEPVIPDDFDQGETPFIRPFMIDLASDHYALDISKARKILNWEPKHTIEKTIPKIIQCLKNNPKEWYKKNHILMPYWMRSLKQNSQEKIRVKYETIFRNEHKKNLWARFFIIGFGFWLITSPITLGYKSYFLQVSDILSGVMLVILGVITLSWRLAYARWICAFIGLWVLFAPLVFWAPTSAAYLNDTFLGTLIIGFSVLIPPYIGVAPHAALKGPKVPPGWTYSPSSWFQRFPIILLAFVGLLISRYMAAYQLGHIDSIWEPFFFGDRGDPKNGTEEIITSYLSHAWPVPDAGLGALIYLLEILTGALGGADRWRTMPWLVLLFGFLIIPLGVVSITFIIIQPILLNTWCTLCLMAAAAMLIQVPYSINEIIATVQFLWRRKKAQRPLWLVLFVGDIDKETRNKHVKTIDDFEQSPLAITREMLGEEITLPWSLIFCLLIGIWLTFTRLTLASSGSMANADHLIGSLLITTTVISFSESVRALRFINLLFAVALLITPFVYEANWKATIASLICGMFVFLFTLPCGKIKTTYGEWNRFIF